MKFRANSQQLKQYETRYPEKQVIKMVDLAKYMEIYAGAPDVVSRGKQAIVKVFSEDIKKQWEKSDTEFNVFYFKRAVALAIIFRETDEIIKETKWYKEKHSYKANVIAYTMSVLFYIIRRNKPDFDIDYIKIWNQQSISAELKSQLTVLCTEVYNFITSADRRTENVTQWCKQALCWERAQKHHWTLELGFVKTLVSKASIIGALKEGAEDRKLENEIDLLKYIMSTGPDYWREVLDWGYSRRLLGESEVAILRLISNMGATGRIPSKKQAQVAIKVRDRLKAEGMASKY
jgi:AIPR protein.